MLTRFLSQFGNKIFFRVLGSVVLISLIIFSLFAFITLNSFKGVLDDHLREMEEYTQDEEFLRETHQAFYGAINDLTSKTYLILGGSLAASVLFSFFISFRLSKNLKVLSNFVRDIDSGNFNTTIRVNSNDEFKVLADYINKMVHSLKDKQTEVQSEKIIMESIVMNLSDGIVMFNEEGKVSIINKAAEKVLEVQKKDVIRKSVKELSSTSNILRLYEIMGRSIEEGWVDEHISIWKGDQTKVYSVRASSVVDKEGVFWGFLAIIKIV